MGQLPKVSQTRIEEFMQQTYQTSSNKLEEANKSKKVFSCNISCDFLITFPSILTIYCAAWSSMITTPMTLIMVTINIMMIVMLLMMKTCCSNEVEKGSTRWVQQRPERQKEEEKATRLQIVLLKYILYNFGHMINLQLNHLASDKPPSNSKK